MRLLLFLGMIAFACVLAGSYGMFHNQISYAVGPDYFYAYKFQQFRIPAAQHGPIGAAMVGWAASWWMGLVVGVPIAAMSFGIPNLSLATRAFVTSAIIVVVLTLGLGLASLLIPPPMAFLPIPLNVSDPEAFGQAAMMHDTSYLGGLIGLVVGVIYMGYKVRHARRTT
ncbi:hypothetical protein MUY35_10180 [Aliiroseovarius sp. S1339]|uniref:hypothetical protein n=1 Tax=Aliiroseovarius sp. S1339 TaxID=2936990 RepID=UPI0020BE24C0|nr:hypothetical protein [Aliiroseovarius sp. S1339]MCK8464217.1 hypothetical protein [Aliiroseovarius sp. S1339]